jgi:nucleosome binding factor SPN SPT16 subunit
MVFTLATMYIVTTGKKGESYLQASWYLSIDIVSAPLAKHLLPLKDGKIAVEIFEVDNKKPETRTEAFEKCLDVIKGAGKKVGTIARSEATGPFADEWRKIYGDLGKEIEEIDSTYTL